jgi:hypothetical protein
MTSTLLVVALAVVWPTTLLYGGAGFGFKGSAAPSLGPGLGAAIAVVVALAGALASTIVVVVLAVAYDTRWPIVACLATLPLPWLVALLKRR